MLVVGTMVSWMAWQQTAEAYLVETLSAIELPNPFADATKDPKAFREVMTAAHRAQLSAIEGMRWPRIVVLGVLSLAAMINGLFALRVRWPGGARRAMAAKVVSLSALVASLVRAMDGGQQLVIARRAAGALELASGKMLPSNEMMGMTALVTVVTAAQTIAVVAAFTAGWRYFGSAKVLQQAQQLDALEEE